MKIDTQQLDPAQGTVEMLFKPILSQSLAAFQLSGNTVAGRAAIDVTPLAICAMDPAAAGQRVWGTYTELIEYGFRRGVSYNLMRLNPQSSSAGANYVVNPVAAPGSAGASSDTDASTVGPALHGCSESGS